MLTLWAAFETAEMIFAFLPFFLGGGGLHNLCDVGEYDDEF
jgi:hypothetical protein